MKKNIFGRKFSRDTNERKALFKNLISSLIINDRIRTTEPKAKAIKGDVDKVITKVKKNGALAKRLLIPILNSQAVEKLINDVAPRFKNRNGGYTRIIRIGRRFGDNAMEVVMEFTEQPKALVSAVSPSRAEGAARQSKSITPIKSRSLSLSRQSSSKRKQTRRKSTSSSPSGERKSGARNKKKQ